MKLGPEIKVFRRDALGGGCSLLHFILPWCLFLQTLGGVTAHLNGDIL